MNTGTETQPPEPTAHPTRMRKWLKILLVLSLGINLLVLGVLVGLALRIAGQGGVRETPRSLGIAMLRELPPDIRRDILHYARSNRLKESAPQAQSVAEIARLLRTDPLDRAALWRILTRRLHGRTAIEEQLRKQLIDRLAKLSHNERIAYADRLEKSIARHGKKRGH